MLKTRLTFALILGCCLYAESAPVSVPIDFTCGSEPVFKFDATSGFDRLIGYNDKRCNAWGTVVSVTFRPVQVE